MKDIKRIMIAHNDNDFVRVWDWIGKVMLIQHNLCGEPIHFSEAKLVKMIRDLIPIGLMHVQGIRQDMLAYDEIHKSACNFLLDASHSNIEHLSGFRYKLNFSYDEKENDWILDGGSEYLIIDFENNQSNIY